MSENVLLLVILCNVQKSFKSATRYVVHPPMYVMYPEDSAHQYQLRAYVYLAKDMHSSDSSGLAGIGTLQNLNTVLPLA